MKHIYILITFLLFSCSDQEAPTLDYINSKSGSSLEEMVAIAKDVINSKDIQKVIEYGDNTGVSSAYMEKIRNFQKNQLFPKKAKVNSYEILKYSDYDPLKDVDPRFHEMFKDTWNIEPHYIILAKYELPKDASYKITFGVHQKNKKWKFCYKLN